MTTKKMTLKVKIHFCVKIPYALLKMDFTDFIFMFPANSLSNTSVKLLSHIHIHSHSDFSQLHIPQAPSSPKQTNKNKPSTVVFPHDFVNACKKAFVIK